MSQYTLSKVIAGSVIVLLACKSNKQVQNQPVAGTEIQPVVPALLEEPQWKFTNVPGTLSFMDMDPKADPRTDFYQFANGSWLRNNPVPSTESSWGSFNVLIENNNKVLRKICEDASSQKNEKGTYLQVVGDFYFSGMDSVTLEKAGTESLKPWLKKVDAIKSASEIGALVGEMNYTGNGFLFDLGVDQDLKDNTKMVLYISQGGLSLPSRDYYTKKDTASVNLCTQYKKHIEKMLGFIGYKPADAQKAAAQIFALELSLANASRTPVELRDPEANYNKLSWTEFGKLIPSFNLEAFRTKFQMAAPPYVIVGQPDFFKHLETVIQKTPIEELKHYFKWRLLHSNSFCLSHNIEAAEFAFFGTRLKGAKKMKPRWKRVLSCISNSSVDEALGRAFVDKKFRQEEKRKVNEMVDNIFAVFKDRLDTLEWMSQATREKALVKLSTFIRKLGFPDTWTDYSTLTIDRTSYLENVMRASAFAMKKNVDKLSKPIDKGEWQMPPHIVNAYYNPLWNEIVFPAGIMQPPFFDASMEDAVNYARMGAVIGHELTHGFDDQGCMFDAEGNLKNWWLSEDSLRFAQRTARLVNCFNKFEALPGVFVNGELTLGENIADLGGIKIAYYAYKRSLRGKKRDLINGFTPEQRFFISFAQIWQTNFTEGHLKVQIFTDPHSPGKYRVIGSLSNLPEFYMHFGVKPGDPMYRTEEERANIW